MIEPTEALTVIDVNTAKSVSKKTSEETYLKTNLEAAGEIAVPAAPQESLRDHYCGLY